MNSDGVKYSKMVDIWALGIILYHTVYEMLPFSSVPGQLFLDRLLTTLMQVGNMEE